jgi:hypothetical protein
MALQWYEYDCLIKLRDRLIGGIPIIPEGADRADAYEKWGRGQNVENDPEFEQPLAEALAEDPDMPVAVAVEDVQGLETGFKRDANGLYIEARQVKAMLRESAQRLGHIKRNKGFRQILQHDLYVRSPQDATQKLYLDRESPDGKETRPISVITRQGPRTALKRFEYVQEVEIAFRIRILAGGIGEEVFGKTRKERDSQREEILLSMLELSCELGLGADRSQGEGTFDVLAFARVGEDETEE